MDLQVKFNNPCWTRVIVDGQLAYEGTAQAGQTLNWKAADNINVRVGDAGAVEFIQNGNNLGIAGSDGEILEKTFIRK